MNRLTKRNEANTAYYYPKCFEKCDGIGASEKCNDCDFTNDVCEKLGEYEYLDEQGLLLKLQCKVGDTVYYKNDSDYIYPIKINEINISNSDITYNGYFMKCTYEYDNSDFGKTVFLTQEQAEEALKKMRETEE